MPSARSRLAMTGLGQDSKNLDCAYLVRFTPHERTSWTHAGSAVSPQGATARRRSAQPQRLRDFVGVLDEKPRNRTDGAVFQGEDADRDADRFHLDRQYFDLGALPRKQDGPRTNRQETPARQEVHPN